MFLLWELGTGLRLTLGPASGLPGLLRARGTSSGGVLTARPRLRPAGGSRRGQDRGQGRGAAASADYDVVQGKLRPLGGMAGSAIDEVWRGQQAG